MAGREFPMVALGWLMPKLKIIGFTTYAQRGCGNSTRPLEQPQGKGTYEKMQHAVKNVGLRTHIADIERIRRILKQEKLILLGHSFGAFIAAMYAAEFPEHVKAIIALSPANLIEFPMEEGTDLYQLVEQKLTGKRREQFIAWKAKMLNFNNWFTHNDAGLVKLNGGLMPFFQEAYQSHNGIAFQIPQKALTNMGGWMMQATFISMGLRHDYSDAIAQIKTPVITIHGDKDLIPARSSQAFADYFVNSTYKSIANAGHFGFAEAPKEYATLVGDFLAKLL